jgi:hypothetical protein
MRVVLFTIFLLSNSLAISQDKKTTPFQNLKICLFTHYFALKELCNIYIISAYYKVGHRLENTKIACLKCHHPLSCSYIWFWIVWSVNEPLLAQLKALVCSGSQEDLESFLLQVPAKETLKCPCCLVDNGWYIVKQNADKPLSIHF